MSGFFSFMTVFGSLWAGTGGIKKTGVFDKPYQSYEEMVRDCNKDMEKYAPSMFALKIKQAREWDQQNKKNKK